MKPMGCVAAAMVALARVASAQTLGTMAYENSNSVPITGGTIAGTSVSGADVALTGTSNTRTVVQFLSDLDNIYAYGN
jgi:hypothetical protein